MKNNLLWLSLISLPLAAVSGTAFVYSDSLGSPMSLATAGTRHPDPVDGQPERSGGNPEKRQRRDAGQLALTVVNPSGGRITLSRRQTVFVDGPTGYTFVWVANEGWRFVGSIVTAGR